MSKWLGDLWALLPAHIKAPDEPHGGDVFLGIGPLSPDDYRSKFDRRPCRCGSIAVENGDGTYRRENPAGAFVKKGSRSYCAMCDTYGQDHLIEAIKKDYDRND